jgi:uncharacterized protein
MLGLPIREESFKETLVLEMSWLNVPPQWRQDGDRLHVTTGDRTDFWRRTFYGFTHDNGHFYHQPVTGDFSAEVTISADYKALYDQAGLMLRVDERNWLKTGIEYTDGAMHFSVVATRNDFSDWSVLVLPQEARDSLDIRLTRHGEALRVQYRTSGSDWRMARLAMLPMGETVAVGMMCCTPERSGLEVTFHNFAVKPPISRQLHD